MKGMQRFDAPWQNHLPLQADLKSDFCIGGGVAPSYAKSVFILPSISCLRRRLTAECNPEFVGLMSSAVSIFSIYRPALNAWTIDRAMDLAVSGSQMRNFVRDHSPLGALGSMT